MTDLDVMARLRRADPLGRAPDAAGTEWAGELRAAIADGPAPAVPAPGRRRRLGRRGGALAVAAAVCLGTGGAIAALTLDDEPHPQTQREIRSALALPAPDRDSLTPVPGGIREAFRAETPLGTWVFATIETRGRGTLVSLGPLRADGSSASTG
ncbi:MAG: hypothetical protein AB7V62_06825, partial [Thermoleophilia bacterium]